MLVCVSGGVWWGMAGSYSQVKSGKNARCHNHRRIIIIIGINKIFGCLGMDLFCSFEFVIMEGELSLYSISFDINERCLTDLDVHRHA